MKITQKQLNDLILEEIEQLETSLEEGVFDYLKGAGSAAGSKASDTGRSIAKSVADKASAVKNKIGQVATDIKDAGSIASLKADLKKAQQESGLAFEKYKSKFTDLLARSQSLRLNDEEKQIKAELGAIQMYQQNSGKIDKQLPPSISKPQLGASATQKAPTENTPIEMQPGVDPKTFDDIPQPSDTEFSSPAPTGISQSGKSVRDAIAAKQKNVSPKVKQKLPNAKKVRTTFEFLKNSGYSEQKAIQTLADKLAVSTKDIAAMIGQKKSKKV